jgi:flagellar P-ring protein FlgI
MAIRLALAAVALLGLALGAAPADADRLKEMVQIEGARDNQLIGYGLVGGLAGTGDQTTQVPYTV